jgi:hypothetical protein
MSELIALILMGIYGVFWWLWAGFGTGRVLTFRIDPSA